MSDKERAVEAELLVLVPVLNRPENVQPLLDSFAESDAAAQGGLLVLLANEDDTDEIAAIRKADRKGALVADVTLPILARSWPQKIDWAWRNVLPLMPNARWILLAADDIRFGPYWYEATKGLREDGQYQVIGTNDLGNPRVMAGDHAVHPLVRFDFASVDDPDTPVHSGYHHWFVDDELVTTAKVRGVWAPCLDSVVEHLHPYFDKGQMDSTYALGERNAKKDESLFLTRLALIDAEAQQHGRNLLRVAPDEGNPR